MRHSPPGSAQPTTDTVKKAMEILKDRPMWQPPPKGIQQGAAPKPQKLDYRSVYKSRG